MRRGGPGCSSQLPEAGRLGLPGTIPSHHCLGAPGMSSTLFQKPIFLASTSLPNPCSLGRLLGFSITGKTPLLLTVAQVPLIAKNVTQNQKIIQYPFHLPESNPHLSFLPYLYFSFPSPNPIHFFPNLSLLWSLCISSSPLLSILRRPPKSLALPTPERALPFLPLPRQMSSSTGAARPPPPLNPCPPTVRNSSAHLSIKAKCKLPAEHRGSEPFHGPLRGSPSPRLPDLTCSR